MGTLASLKAAPCLSLNFLGPVGLVIGEISEVMLEKMPNWGNDASLLADAPVFEQLSYNAP